MDAYQALLNKYNEQSDKLDGLYQLALIATNSGYMDVDAILDMEKHHRGTIERADEVRDEVGDGGLEFWHFVDGVHRVALAEVDGFLDDLIAEADEDERLTTELGDLKESIEQVSIDANYSAWGSLADYGPTEATDAKAVQRNHDAQEAFADFVNGTYDIDEFMESIRKIYGASYERNESVQDAP